jgi:hypothetical protein
LWDNGAIDRKDTPVRLDGQNAVTGEENKTERGESKRERRSEKVRRYNQAEAVI